MPFSAFRSLTPTAQIGFAMLGTVVVVGGFVVVAIALIQSDLTTSEKTQIGTMATIAGGFAVKEWRDARNRAWAKKDREDGLKLQTAEIIERAQAEATALMISTEAKAKAIRLEVAAAAERIQKETVLAAAVLREDQRVNSEMLASQIAEVKEVATNAFHEANGVKQLLSQDKKDASRETGKKLDDIKSTADDIEQKVDNLGKRE